MVLDLGEFVDPRASSKKPASWKQIEGAKHVHFSYSVLNCPPRKLVPPDHHHRLVKEQDYNECGLAALKGDGCQSDVQPSFVLSDIRLEEGIGHANAVARI